MSGVRCSDWGGRAGEYLVPARMYGRMKRREGAGGRVPVLAGVRGVERREKG